jgi:hypothetical protein
MQRGDWRRAIGIASKFYDLGAEKAAIMRAASAFLSPAMYRQMGQDPAALIEAGKQALIRRYGRKSD